jgi:MFS transporter, DHA1 family, multidrug resistance protein
MPVVPNPRRPGLFRALPREVAILSSVSFTVALGYGIVAPGIPAFARQFGVSTAAAASVISAFALMRIIGALPSGRLVDRIGERKMIVIGIAIVAASSAFAGFSGSFAQLIVLRGVGGLGSAMFSVGAQTLLLRCVPSGLRGRASGLYTGGFLLGGISGPAIGGLVAAWSLRAPFFIYGGMLLIPAAIAVVVLHDSPRRAAGEETRPQRPLAGLAAALRSRAYRAAASANLADGFAVMGVRSAIVPLFVRDVLHESATWTGIGFLVVAALNAATLLPGGKVADTLGRRPVIVAGCVTSGVSMVMLAVLPGLWGFLLALAVLGLGSGLLDVAPAAMIGDLLGGKHAGSAQGGTVVASYQMAGDIGTVSGPVAVGFLVDTVSYGAAFVLAAGVLGIAAVASFVAPETRTAPAEHVAAERMTAEPVTLSGTPGGQPHSRLASLGRRPPTHPQPWPTATGADSNRQADRRRQPDLSAPTPGPMPFLSQ